MSKPNWTFVTSKQVWMDKSLSIEAKAIWHILSAWRDIESGESYPKVWTLQQVSGMGRNKVEKALRELVDAKAITRRMERVRRSSGIYGSRAVYSVTKLSEWVGKDIYKKDPEMQFSGAPETRGTWGQRVSLTHHSSINHPPSVIHPLSPNASAEHDRAALSESETEAFLEDRGFGSSVAATVWERMCSVGWVDANRKSFANRRQLEAYLVGLAQTIEDARTSAGRPAKPVPPVPVSQFSKCH